MIHDIYPHKLGNEYLQSKSQANDIIICTKENKIMIGGKAGEARFPERKDFAEGLECWYLFSLDGRGVYWALQEGMEPLEGFSYLTVREIRWQMCGPLEYMYLVYTAWHLICWYRDNRFCGRCGHHTHHSDTERALACGDCGHVIYPRIVPAIVAGVIWDDKILLTKYANRNVPFYALVAGFTEIGETLEECVAREVMEEAGLRVKNIRYYKSQPWGSVQDLIVGFYCDVDGGTDIHMDSSELKEAVWVKREDIQGQPDDWSLTNQMMMTFKAGKEPSMP